MIGLQKSLKIFHKMTMFVSLYLYNLKTKIEAVNQNRFTIFLFLNFHNKSVNRSKKVLDKTHPEQTDNKYKVLNFMGANEVFKIPKFTALARV